ncbi:MAG TPA: alpha/beta fold hydrolase [Rubrobacteraceae bacterium]|nr:alpha/beta fold hydrolase [Rubrobacteraceae bacterium]
MIVYWSWIDAQARAVIVLSSILETPLLTPAIEVLTEEPRVEDTILGGMPTLVAKPGSEGPWPALLFVNGTTPEGRELPEVQNLARGLARAGYLVVVPDLPGLRTDEINEKTVSSTLETARVTADHPDARDGRVGLVGVSTGATLALLAAEDPNIGERISVVAGIAPYSDIRTVLNIATTGYYKEDEHHIPYETDPFLSYAITRSLVAALPAGEDQDKLRAELEEVDRRDPDPLSGLRARSTDDLGPEARSVVKLLANEDPERFDELYASLPPEIRARMDHLSPLARSKQLAAPVELASGPKDKYFPVTESFALARIAPNQRVTVTAALGHSYLDPSLEDIPAFVSLDGFVVRSLRQARLAEPSG